MRRSTTPSAAILLAAALGCAGGVELRGIDVGAPRDAAGPRVGTLPGAVDSVPRRPPVGPVQPGAPIADPGAERRVCRASRPTGWIAVAYLPGDDCPRAAGDATNATAALVVRLAGRGPNAVLDVCADERVPRGWRVERRAIVDAAGRCPGAAPDGRSAVMRIRRVR